MDNRVYYGQYSLKHWIDLILKQNLLLPKYQRFFVWEEKDVSTLIETFKNKQFVPPITIGAFTVDGKSNNLILDGQQRLTSILLAYLGIYPDKTFFKTTYDRLASDNDDGLEEEPDPEDLDEILDWNLKKITEKGTNKEQILAKIIEGNYKPVNFNLPAGFWEKNFLGFSFLVPNAATTEVQQKYFSSVFRNINIQGKALLAQESRASLYFLKQDFDKFFNPQFFRELSVKNSNVDTKADFVRFMSLLSQYARNAGTGSLVRGFKSVMEAYYEEYIYSIVGENTSGLFKDFTEIFPDNKFQSKLDQLAEAIHALGIPKQFPSIIDMDVYLFGLIYEIVFENRAIDVVRKDALKVELDAQIAVFKASDLHKRNPGALKYLKQRITDSVNIYKKYIHE